MARRGTFGIGASFLALLIATPADADEPKAVRIPDQTVSARTVAPDIVGIIRDGEYAGVKFHAVPDPAIPLPQEYQPDTLLAKLDPTLNVQSVGSPPFDGAKNREEILSVLPQTAFRLKSLTAADGTYGAKLEEPPIIVYVTGYKPAPGYTPGLEDLKEGRLEEKRVYISAYIISFGRFPPCSSFTLLCTPQAAQ